MPRKVLIPALALTLAAAVWHLACLGPTDDMTLASSLGRGLVAACPDSAPDDEGARARCAQHLTAFSLLRDSMAEPFLWGAQQPNGGARLDQATTKFNALVWRRMYLSLYSFAAPFQVEQADGGLTLLHLQARFRNQLDIGSYPYPFWHSLAKWQSYQRSVELIMFIKKGRLVAALRAADQDPYRDFVAHSWDGQWQWTQSGQEMPYAALYRFLFSPSNPYVSRLDTSFRAMSAAMRQTSCLVCHSPDNAAHMTQLELLNLPNQALSSRHDIVRALENNTMPPTNKDFGITLAGLTDESQRQHLLELARAFAEAGDSALAFEGELKPDVVLDGGLYAP